MDSKTRRLQWALVPLLLTGITACGGDSASAAKWCDLAKDVEATSLDDLDVFDAAAVEQGFAEFRTTLADALKDAPDEIKDDVETVKNGMDTLYEELDKVDFDFMSLDQAVISDLDAEMTEASDAIDAYNEKECGITPTTDAPSSDTGSDTTDAFTGEGTVRDMLVQQFVAMGLTEDQATCLSDNIDMESMTQDSSPDLSGMTELFATCDITLEQLGQLGQS